MASPSAPRSVPPAPPSRATPPPVSPSAPAATPCGSPRPTLSGDITTFVDAVTLNTVTAPAVTVGVVSSANPATAGSSVTLTATVSGSNPAGNVAFTDGGSVISGCSAVALTGSGNSKTAACSTSSLAVGSHSIVANYAGDANNAPTSSTPLVQTINPVAGAVALTNSGFETPALGNGGYQYQPTTTGWVFNSQGGIQRNGSAWGAATAPEGQQTAFLQGGNAQMAQTLNLPAGTYSVSFYAARRAYRARRPAAATEHRWHRRRRPDQSRQHRLRALHLRQFHRQRRQPHPAVYCDQLLRRQHHLRRCGDSQYGDRTGGDRRHREFGQSSDLRQQRYASPPPSAAAIPPATSPSPTAAARSADAPPWLSAAAATARPPPAVPAASPSAATASSPTTPAMPTTPPPAAHRWCKPSIRSPSPLR